MTAVVAWHKCALSRSDPDGQYPYGYNPYGIMDVPGKSKSFEHAMERPHEGSVSSTWEGENAAHHKTARTGRSETRLKSSPRLALGASMRSRRSCSEAGELIERIESVLRTKGRYSCKAQP